MNTLLMLAISVGLTSAVAGNENDLPLEIREKIYQKADPKVKKDMKAADSQLNQSTQSLGFLRSDRKENLPDETKRRARLRKANLNGQIKDLKIVHGAIGESEDRFWRPHNLKGSKKRMDAYERETTRMKKRPVHSELKEKIPVKN